MSRIVLLSGSQIEAVRRAAKRTQNRIDSEEAAYKKKIEKYQQERKNHDDRKQRYEKADADEKKRMGYIGAFQGIYPNPPKLDELYADLIHLADIQKAYDESRKGNLI